MQLSCILQKGILIAQIKKKYIFYNLALIYPIFVRVKWNSNIPFFLGL